MTCIYVQDNALQNSDSSEAGTLGDRAGSGLDFIAKHKATVLLERRGDTSQCHAPLHRHGVITRGSRRVSVEWRVTWNSVRSTRFREAYLYPRVRCHIFHICEASRALIFGCRRGGGAASSVLAAGSLSLYMPPSLFHRTLEQH